ncbi:MAG: NUDIX hydrolase [Acidimicrobiales bacterium]|nr:NUDIX hydrolase [Acidimicrobiales bacterium]
MSAGAGPTGEPAGFVHLGDEVLHAGAVISLVRASFAAPDGSHFTREVVRHPGAVSVVPLHADGTVTLVRQYRAALDRELLEIPAGKRDVPGEPPEITAERELAEEVGLRAGRLEPLAQFVNSAGFSDEYSHVFLATELTEVDDARQGLEEQHMSVERVALGDVPALVARHEIVDAKTVIGLTLALVRLGGAPEGRGG